MTTELQDAAMRLIPELPDDATRLRFSHLRAIHDLQRRIAEVMLASAEADERMLAVIATCNPVPDVPIGAYLGEAEIERAEANARRALDAERANAALDGWKVRSGYTAAAEAFAGEKMPRPELLHMENADDGSVLLYCPPQPGGGRR